MATFRTSQCQDCVKVLSQNLSSNVFSAWSTQYEKQVKKSDIELKVAEHSLRAVSGNLRDGACFKLHKQTWRRKSNGTQKTISQNLHIKIL